jgi:hypothetical protein
MKRRVRSAAWLAAGLGLGGIGLTGVLQNTAPAFVPVGYVLLSLALISLGIAAAAFFGIDERDETLSPEIPALLPPTAPEEPPPNVRADHQYIARIHDDHSYHVLRHGDGTRFDTPFTGAVVSFRNTFVRRRAGVDAYDVKAQITIHDASGTTMTLAGYWLNVIEGEHDGVRIAAGGAERELVIAVRDRDGMVAAVQRSDTAHPEYLPVWQPQLGSKKFSVEVLLASNGSVLATARYELRLSDKAFEIVRA